VGGYVFTWACSSGDRATVSGAVCRRFESFQARQLLFLQIIGKVEIFSSTICVRYSFLYSNKEEELPKKRGNGEGSVYRRKDGLWVGQYVIKTPNGSKTKYIDSKSRKEAVAKLTKTLSENRQVEQYMGAG
jgi:hypothetical protein